MAQGFFTMPTHESRQIGLLSIRPTPFNMFQVFDELDAFTAAEEERLKLASARILELATSPFISTFSEHIPGERVISSLPSVHSIAGIEIPSPAQPDMGVGQVSSTTHGSMRTEDPPRFVDRVVYSRMLELAREQNAIVQAQVALQDAKCEYLTAAQKQMIIESRKPLFRLEPRGLFMCTQSTMDIMDPSDCLPELRAAIEALMAKILSPSGPSECLKWSMHTLATMMQGIHSDPMPQADAGRLIST